MSSASDSTKQHATMTNTQRIVVGFGCSAAVCWGMLFRHNMALRRAVRSGALATTPKYAATVQKGTLKPQLLHPIPDHPMVVLVGSQQAGKTFSMSHAAETRKNSLFIDVWRDPAGEPHEWNSTKLLSFMYDEATDKLYQNSLLQPQSLASESFAGWSRYQSR